MYSLVLMTAMTASAPEAPKCFCLFHGFFARPTAAAGSGCGGCHGCNGGCSGNANCRGCYGCTGCTGCNGCAGGYGGAGYAIGGVSTAYRDWPNTQYPSAGSTAFYVGSEGIWAGTWSYSGIVPGQGPSYTPGAVSKVKMPEPMEETSAQIIVQVPADAKLYIDGKLMDGTTTERSFYTPPLAQGQSYFYDVRLETVKDGKTVVQDKKVIVQAGALVKESFKRSGELTSLASGK